MLPAEIQEALASVLSNTRGIPTRIRQARPLSGGSINHAFLLETDAGRYFMKYNLADAYPGMFNLEARGLAILLDAGELRVPVVIGCGEAGKYTYLLMEYLESAPKNSSFWEVFGHKLAALHKHSADRFGLDHDNYIGSLKQYNGRYSRWTDFFRDERLVVQMEMAARGGLLPARVKTAFERLFNRLDEIFPEEPPSLIHGDLWSGNYMVDDRGEACIIDPAVYYGSREMDIGMSRLFGVFGTAFYEAYNEAWPMAPGWQQRIEVCNLYPLMVHVNLFGSGYLGSVESILSVY